VQPAVGVGVEELVADGRVGAALQEQADHLELTVQDRPVQAGPPEGGRDDAAPGRSSRRTYSTRLEKAAQVSGRSRLVALPISTSTAARPEKDRARWHLDSA